LAFALSSHPRRGSHLRSYRYCGTAGTLIAAAAYGARTLGCDLHLPALRGELRTRSGRSKLNQPTDQGIHQTFAAYGLPPCIGLVHGDSGEHLNCLRIPRARASNGSGGSGGSGGGSGSGGSGGGGGGLFDAIISDPPYGIREKPAEVADERYTSRTLPQSMMEGHVPRRALAELETILTDLFALARTRLAYGGRLVFLLPTTAPFEPSLLPPHPGLIFEAASEQLMAARWSRWVVVLRRDETDAHDDSIGIGGEAHGSARRADAQPARIFWSDGSITIAHAPKAAPAATTSVAPPADTPIFNRASLRPDDVANLGANGDVGADPERVLHPQLLGKSAGARKRLEKRLARAAGAEAEADDDAARGARSARRRARNAGRDEYENLVRERLAMGAAHEPQGAWAAAGAWVRVAWRHRLVLLTVAAAATFVVRTVRRR
jgi:hypothetical protein